MPSLTEARDELFALAKAAMDGDSAFDTVVKIYQDTFDSPPEDGTTSWCELSITHNPDGRQYSLGGATTGRKFQRTGLFVAKVFTPNGNGLNTADELCTIILAAYEGQTTASGIWFRTAGVTEIGSDGKYHQTNVFVSFEYEEAK